MITPAETEQMKVLLIKDSINKEEVELLISYLKKLSHELGNGTLTRYKDNSKQCKDIIQRIGELNDILIPGESK